MKYQISMILLLLALTACSSPPVNNQFSCPDNCTDRDFLNYTITERFMVSDYKVICSECAVGRGSHIKARIQANGTVADIYYRNGWCSSGGSDCGWYMSFRTNKPSLLYNSIMATYCNSINNISNMWREDPICSSFPTYDNTEEIRQRCLDGEFEDISGDTKAIAIDYISGRCNSYAKKGNTTIYS